MASRPPAVIIGLDSITGLQTARILARHGVPLLALAKDPRHFCCRTRVCEHVIRADTESENLIGALERLGPTLEEKAVLFPCADVGVALISRHRRRLEPWFHAVLPAHETVELLMDKVRFVTYAQEHGLSVPRTFVLRNRGDAERASDSLCYPAVLKPSLRSPEWDRHVVDKAFKPSTPGELLALYDRTARWTDTFVAQEWVAGGESSLYSCNCYFDSEARPLVTFVAKKIRQWPPQTGISSLGEECRNDAVLEETVRLFRGTRLRGLGYLEMKRDERTGEHFIIEPNIGRPTGRSAIAEAGGVELLYTQYCDAAGLPLPAARVQRYDGAKWIYARSDLQSAVHYWRRGELGLAEWRASVRGCRVDAVFSRRDPAPFVFDLWRVARRLVDQRRMSLPARATPRPPATPARAPNGSQRPAMRLEPVDSLESLRPEWSGLAERSRNIFATWEWASIWWRHFGARGEQLISACRAADGRLLGIVPLYRPPTGPLRVLRFLGHGTADQLGPICAPEDREEVGRALPELMSRLRADILLAEHLPANQQWDAVIGGTVLRTEGSPVLRFEAGSWDELLRSWSSNRRSQMRRLERKLFREHAMRYRLADDPARLDRDLDTLFALHAARWNNGHSHFGGKWEAFHREFAAVAAEHGWLRLWFLEADSRPVSAWYGFRFGGVESYYQAGRDPSWKHGSIGLVLLAHTIRAALEDGMGEYRFLRGAEEFKYRFANEDPRLQTIGVARGAVGQTALTAGTLVHERLARVPLRHWLAL